MSSVTERDWYTWHHDYDEPGSDLAQRLAAVQDQIRVALDAAPPGPPDRLDRLGRAVGRSGSLRFFRDPRGDLGP